MCKMILPLNTSVLNAGFTPVQLTNKDSAKQFITTKLILAQQKQVMTKCIFFLNLFYQRKQASR